MERAFVLSLLLSAAAVSSGCAHTQAKFEPWLALEPSPKVSTAIRPEASPTHVSRQGVFKVIDAGGKEKCVKPSDEMMKLYDKYGAWHFCFSYALAIEGSWHSLFTEAIVAAVSAGGAIPGLQYVQLYQPNKNVLRFQVPNEGSYRLYTYWQRNLSNVPPPGKFTDHKFINVMDRSIDYYLKIQKRKRAANSRIGGVAEVVFLPDEMCAQARRDGFLDKIGSIRQCPENAGPALK